jgi:hypothetical protein
MSQIVQSCPAMKLARHGALARVAGSFMGRAEYCQVNHFSRIGTMRLVSKALSAMAMPA